MGLERWAGEQKQAEEKEAGKEGEAGDKDLWPLGIWADHRWSSVIIVVGAWLDSWGTLGLSIRQGRRGRGLTLKGSTRG